jgi:hypothetical protein
MRTTIAALSALLFLPLPAQAGPILVEDFVGVFVGYFSPVTTGEARALLGSSRMSGGVGISPSIDGQIFEAYCVDILGPIFNPGTPQPPATFDATAASMTMWDRYAGALPTAGRNASWLYNNFAAAIASADDNVGRTALQMAIWNVLYDADFTVSLGNFRVNPSDAAVTAAANSYLNALFMNQPSALLSDATWLQLQDCSVSPCRDVQDFIGPLTSVPVPVPEPAALAFLTTALAGTLLRVRRRARA